MVWRVVIVLVVLAVALPVGVFATAYIVTDVPEPEQLVTKQVSTVYAADGQTELARIVPPEGNRQAVSLEQMPQSLLYAVMSAEDREFYSNPGFSLTGFGRAVIGQLTGNSSAGGGSTITQQYVKNAVVGNERSIRRKLKELVISAKMANQWSKDDVLEAYLNTIYFGRSSYGVAAAARAYFGIPIDQLTPAQSAVLAAAIQRPSQLDPWFNREAAEARWNYVLDGMVKMGYLIERERADMVYPEVTDPATNQPYTVAQSTNGLIKNRVMAELNRLGLSEHDVQTKGLRVTTTIDPKVQNAIVDAVNDNAPDWDDQIRQAVVSIDPRTGAVKGYYGGEDPQGWDYANGPRPTGSTFKIFGLAAALTQGIPLTQGYSSAPVQTGDTWVTNSDGETCGFCSIETALKMSLNTSFLRLEGDLFNGPQDVADTAHALGVARTLPGIGDTLAEPGDTPPYDGIILGQYDSRPFDMAVGLSTLANQGIWHQPHFVELVTDSAGQVLYRHRDGQGQRRVGANVANSVINAMLPIASWSNGKTLPNRQSAVKTGTVQLGDTGQNKDAWWIGATPQLATAVWVGTENNTPLTNSWGGPMYGAGLPGTIWQQLMTGALTDEEILEFPQAKPLGYTSPKITLNYGGSGWSGSAPPAAETIPEETEGQQPAEPVEPAPAPAPPEQIEILPGVSVPNIFGL
nr:transglycosylase domain-containing protein [Corynebacterium mendelii]